MIAKLVVAALLVVAFASFLWASDRITVQGERTVYTVECVGGEWQGLHCTGKLAAGDRHTFKASRTRQEVLFWIVGSAVPSGRYSDCLVKDRGNWTCNVRIDEPRTVTYEMQRDVPTVGVAGLALPFHAVPKWKWWAIREGLGSFTDAGI